MIGVKTRVFKILNHPGLGWSIIKGYYRLTLKKKYYSYDVVSPVEYAQKHEKPCKCMEQASNPSRVIVPKLNGDYETKEIRESIPQPGAYVIEIENAVVTGATDGVICGSEIVNERIETSPERTWVPLPFWSIAANADHKKLLGERVLPETRIEKGIDLCGRFAGSWWHTTYETLAKMTYMLGLDEYEDFPLLVDELVVSDESNRKLLESINVNGREVITIKKDSAVQVDRLVYINNPVTEILGEYTKKYNIGCAGLSIYLFCRKRCVEFIRNSVFKYLKIEDQEPERKVFLARARKGRLINEDEVAAFYGERGFEVVYSDELSFEEEVKTFFGAKILISTMGGALTNLAYCHKNSKIVCIFPHQISSIMSFYSSISDVIGFEFYCQDALLLNDPMMPNPEYKLSDDMCRELAERLNIV